MGRPPQQIAGPVSVGCPAASTSTATSRQELLGCSIAASDEGPQLAVSESLFCGKADVFPYRHVVVASYITLIRATYFGTGPRTGQPTWSTDCGPKP